MSAIGNSGSSAFHAEVRVGDYTNNAQQMREQRADALSQAAQDLKELYRNEKNRERKTALKAALTASEAEAELARAEALKGSE